MADDNEIDQQEIERLLSQSAAPDSGEATPSSESSGDALDQSEIEALLDSGGATPPSGGGQPPSSAPPVAGDEEMILGQDEIEKLLGQAGGATPATKQAPRSRPNQAADAGPKIAQADMEYLLNQAQDALDSIDADMGQPPENVSEFRLEEFTGATASTESTTLDLIRDVELDLKIELGRTHMYLEDVLRLRRGSVVPLDKLAGDPVDIFVNGRLIARGEVLVLNDNFCVRVAELLAGIPTN